MCACLTVAHIKMYHVLQCLNQKHTKKIGHSMRTKAMGLAFSSAVDPVYIHQKEHTMKKPTSFYNILMQSWSPEISVQSEAFVRMIMATLVATKTEHF